MMQGEDRSRTKTIASILTLCSLISLFGCTSFRVAGEVQTGRYALLAGKPEIALAHFRHAAELDSDYILNFSYLRQGIWTYVGRAYYDAGKWPEARKALERALQRYRQDYMARLYLGLVLARNGNPRTGAGEIEAGLQGLESWLEDMEQNHPAGKFWDPGKRLRAEIRHTLALISTKETSWKDLIARGEWLGREFEEEIDRARQDKSDELYRNNGGDGGGMG